MQSTPLSAGTLAGLSDTDIASLANLDLVAWNASASKFENMTAAEAGLAATSHTHTASNITDLTEAVQDIVGAFFSDTSTIDITYNDAAGTLVADILAANTLAALSVFTGDSGAGGSKGLVPAPAAGDATKFLRGDGTFADAPGTGTVTSVACTVPSGFSVAGSPVSTSGTLAITADSAAANLVYATPNGSAGVPVLRALELADLPSGIGGGSTGWEANLLVNSSFQSWTHGATSTTAPTPTAFTDVADAVYCGPDRWKFYRDSLVLQIKQVSGREGYSSYAVEVKNASGSGGGKFSWSQAMESADVLALRGSQVTASVQIAPQTETATYSLLIYEHTGTADSLDADPFSDWDNDSISEGALFGSSANYSLLASATLSCSSGSWHQLSVTATVGSSANNLKAFVILHGSNSLSNGASVKLTEFGLYPGSSAPTYRETPWSITERDCMRWHVLMTGAGLADFYKSGRKVLTNRIRAYYDALSVPMRSTPTITNNVSGWTAGNPTTTTIAGYDEMLSTSLAMTGSLTFVIQAYDRSRWTCHAQATSFTGTTGDYVELAFGEDVVLHFNANL